MLFTSKLSLQPKKEVLIERKEPTKIFAKLLHSLTSGLSSSKEKHQTFTAVSMLQELNIALRQANITNIVRLAKDGNDFYFDEEGKEDDLAEAMKEFKIGTDHFEATLFNDLYLVLEYLDDKMRYLIEIDIQRVHREDEMPINIAISGVINELAAQGGESKDKLEARLGDQFKNKYQYESFVTRYRGIFDLFVNNLEQTLRTTIRCEAIEQNTKSQVLRPSKKGVVSVTDPTCSPGIYRGYSGWETAAMYTFLWMPMMTSMAVDASDMDIIGENGDVLQSIGDEGLDISESALFDPSVDQADLPSFDGPTRIGAGDGDSGGSSWLDFGGGDSGDAGSSCGGSGCGGGCGG
jgi:hypothetical protein